MSKDEALKTALEALERYQVKRQDFDSFSYVITAIKEALAQPEQEPVAFSCLRCATPKKCAVHGCSPNTWPSESSPKRPWVGLTAQEAADCWTTSATKTWHNFEAALKEKNT